MTTNDVSSSSGKPVHEKRLRALAAELKALMWAGPEVHAALQAHGVQVSPSNFYANIPSVKDVESSFEYGGESEPYADSPVFDEARMLGFLAEIEGYAEAFDPPKAAEAGRPHQFYWDNPAFSFSDAMAYYCIVRHWKPRRIVEVGSGLSTLVASQAVQDNGVGEIVVVEPYPKDFLRDTPHVSELVERPVQEIGPEWFGEQLQDGDLLFIDSTHTVKAGSDCLHLYLRVLPALRARLMVHAHDIFLPDAMPQSWALEKHIYWTEQYLLLALLTGNPSLESCLGVHFLGQRRPEEMDRFMGGKHPRGGGSFWFRANAGV